MCSALFPDAKKLRQNIVGQSGQSVVIGQWTSLVTHLSRCNYCRHIQTQMTGLVY